jgi:hypothetical protein
MVKFLWWGVVSTSLNTQGGGLPLVGCVQLLLQYICRDPLITSQKGSVLWEWWMEVFFALFSLPLREILIYEVSDESNLINLHWGSHGSVVKDWRVLGCNTIMWWVFLTFERFCVICLQGKAILMWHVISCWLGLAVQNWVCPRKIGRNEISSWLSVIP